MFERFHIDMAKDGWRASNFKNEVPQMTCWLSRQEKVSLFQSYIQDFISLQSPPIKYLLGYQNATTFLS